MAKYDVPDTIDYILSATEQKQLVYIGHSQGTLTAFAALSTNRTLRKKIKLFIAMAPIVTIGHIMVLSLRALADATTFLAVSMVDCDISISNDRSVRSGRS
jgi:pimeloyl-ACP methyl ester carboxylesterase